MTVTEVTMWNSVAAATGPGHDRPVTSPAAFTIDDNRHGGFYELAIEVGDTNNDRVDRALPALWRAAQVRGMLWQP
ncbi:hypothetical protein [Phytohabitans aurantiacus]|uniref:hypothetical protein n=1 Tax=Phytohabitans aurantiacus TaxID=3016789 RepID=UPI00248F9711|nr:hypothetical protein [Phytohabitans aurantiacus]